MQDESLKIAWRIEERGSIYQNLAFESEIGMIAKKYLGWQE